MGKELSCSGAFYYTLGGALLGGVTPMHLGGIPLQLYICKREDITLLEGSAYGLFKHFVPKSVLLVYVVL